MTDRVPPTTPLPSRAPALKYDITLKSLLMDGAPALLAQLAGTSQVTLAPAEFPATITRSADLVGALPGEQLLHTEVQSNNDGSIGTRMLGYYWMFLEANPKADVIQIVLYIGNGPLRMADGLTRTGLALTYRVIDARTLDPAPLLASQSVADVVASFLCRADNIEQRVCEILDRLRSRCAGDDQALAEAISRLVLLADLRGAGTVIEKEIRDMPITINIENNPILLRLYTRGLNEGKAEGKAEGKTEMLLGLMRHRYGPLPDEAVAKVLAAAPEQLDAWSYAVLEVDTLADLLARRPET
jgi:hypothetical protein